MQTKGWFREEPVGNIEDRDAFYAHINLEAAYFLVGMKRGIMTAESKVNCCENFCGIVQMPV